MTARRRQRQHYTLEFKREAVALSQRQQDEGRPLAAIARDLGVLPATLRYWQQAVSTAPSAEGTTARNAKALQLEVKRLQRELARVEEERDFLKRAAAFFAKESP
jgi:transposase